MADKFTKTESAKGVTENDWKEVNVKKEHTPAVIESSLNYVEMENDLAELQARIDELALKKTNLSAEMVKVKTAAQAE